MPGESPRTNEGCCDGQQAVSSPSSEFITVELTAEHRVADFRCARDLEAVKYLVDEVPDFIGRRYGSVFVFPSRDGSGRIDGYYHLVGSSLKRGDAQNSDQKHMPRGAPAPVHTIAYIAKDDRALRGLGAALVVDAARRARAFYPPTWGMTLYANNRPLIRFYEGLGFKVCRSIRQEIAAAEGLQGEGPFLMYAPYETLIVEDAETDTDDSAIDEAGASSVAPTRLHRWLRRFGLIRSSESQP